MRIQNDKLIPEHNLVEDGNVFELITPEVSQFLINNMYERNRRINKTTVTKYARDMSNNKFNKCYDPIIILKNGKTGNGNHRSHASVLSNHSYYCPVIFNVPEEDYNKLDQGRPRTKSEIAVQLGISGTLATYLSALWFYDKYKNFILKYHRSGYILNNTEYASTSFELKYDFIKKYHDLNLCEDVYKCTCSDLKLNKSLLNHTILSVLYTYMAEIDYIKFNLFRSKLTNKIISTENEAYIPKMLMYFSNNPENSSKDYLKVYSKIAIMIKAWNLFYNNRYCTGKLSWRKFKLNGDDEKIENELPLFENYNYSKFN